MAYHLRHVRICGATKHVYYISIIIYLLVVMMEVMVVMMVVGSVLLLLRVSGDWRAPSDPHRPAPGWSLEHRVSLASSLSTPSAADRLSPPDWPAV